METMPNQFDDPLENIEDRDLYELISPEEMAELLRRSEPDNPMADVARRREVAVKAQKQADVNFWDEVRDILSEQLNLPPIERSSKNIH